MFTVGIDKYEKGMVGNAAIVMGVVERSSMKSPLLKILGQHHWKQEESTIPIWKVLYMISNI